MFTTKKIAEIKKHLSIEFCKNFPRFKKNNGTEKRFKKKLSLQQNDLPGALSVPGPS